MITQVKTVQDLLRIYTANKDILDNDFELKKEFAIVVHNCLLLKDQPKLTKAMRALNPPTHRVVVRYQRVLDMTEELCSLNKPGMDLENITGSLDTFLQTVFDSRVEHLIKMLDNFSNENQPEELKW